MKTGADGIVLIHHYEQCQLRAYPDPASPLFAALVREAIYPYGLTAVPPDLAHLSGAPWTIGWGDTGPDVVPGLAITQESADARLTDRLAREFEPGVTLIVRKGGATQNQFDALVSFAYNLGVFSLRDSTLLRLHNAGMYGQAAAEFGKWVKAGGKVMKGLQRRRHAEQAVYQGMDAAAAIGHALEMFP